MRGRDDDFGSGAFGFAFVGPPDEEDVDDELDDDDYSLEDTEVGGENDASCPHCGEPISIFVDPGGGHRQEYVEDCSVCCRPCSVIVELQGGQTYSVDLIPLD